MVTPPQAGISLCSGIGGLDLGLVRAIGPSYSTVCFVEGEAYAAAVLAARMADGALCDAPIWSDVKTFDGKQWRGKVDCITAGYPCQPFSNAGKRAGEQDPRHLWPAIATIVRDVRPVWVFCENVPGHISLGLQQVIADLEGLGYNVEAGLFSAEECGAPHVRQRLFLLAYADSSGLRDHVNHKQHADDAQAKPCDYGSQRYVANANSKHGDGRESGKRGQSMGRQDNSLHSSWTQNISRTAKCSQDVAHADSMRQLQQKRFVKNQRGRFSDSGQNVAHADSQRLQTQQPLQCSAKTPSFASHGETVQRGQTYDWATEPLLDRVVTGTAHRLDRLRALGNAVVPAVAQKAFATLYERHTLKVAK